MTPTITLTTFGFKHGNPPRVDIMFDVRSLLNPYSDPQLRPLDGRDPKVQAYVAKSHDWHSTLARVILETVTNKHIAIGCTGGHHRSVAVAEVVAQMMRAEGHTVIVQHINLKE